MHSVFHRLLIQRGTAGAVTTRTDPDTLVQNVLYRCGRIPHVRELNNGNICLEEGGEPYSN